MNMSELTDKQLADEYHKLVAEDKKMRADQDKKMIEKGYKFRMNGWIHADGDDKETVAYAKSSFTLADINRILKRSVVKTDYKITTLG